MEQFTDIDQPNQAQTFTTEYQLISNESPLVDLIIVLLSPKRLISRDGEKVIRKAFNGH